MDIHSELIEKYLQGKCSSAEQEDVARMKAEDVDFAQELKLTSLAFGAIAIGERERQRKRLMELSKKLQQQPVPLYVKYRNYLKVAAVVLVLVVAGIALWPIINPSPSVDMLLAQHLDIKKLESNAFRADRGKDQVTDSLLSLFITQLNAKECSEAEQNMEALTKLLKDDNLYIHTGVCYLKKNQAAKALEVLQKVDLQSMEMDKVSWYTALAYLMIQDKEAAIQQLFDHQKNGYVFKKGEVEKLLKALKHALNKQ